MLMQPSKAKASSKELKQLMYLVEDAEVKLVISGFVMHKQMFLNAYMDEWMKNESSIVLDPC